MFTIKHKQSPKVIFLVISAITLLAVFLVPAKAFAVNVTCPDGYTATNIPQGEKDAVCAEHQTGGPENDNVYEPGCYTEFMGSLSRSSNCGTLSNPDPAKCYKAPVTSSGIGTYSEFPCNSSSAAQLRTDLGTGGTAGSVTGTGSGANVTDVADCKVDPNTEELDSNNCRIVYWINLAINVMSVLVGIVVTIMIIVGGIQYTAAREDPNAVAKAKKQIFNAVFALVIYGLMFALLQYLIPGGLL